MPDTIRGLNRKIRASRGHLTTLFLIRLTTISFCMLLL